MLVFCPVVEVEVEVTLPEVDVALPVVDVEVARPVVEVEVEVDRDPVVEEEEDEEPPTAGADPLTYLAGPGIGYELKDL